MKIGILTLPIAENYGGILQALALYRFLDKRGHKVVLVYKKPYQSLWKKIALEILLKIPFHDFRNVKTNNKELIDRKKRKSYHKEFIEKEIFKISKELYTKKDLEDFSLKENFDAVIVGSDQVWRKAYINDIYYKSFFLDFVDSRKTKKIAYASSFGKNHWEGRNDKEEVALCLNDFHAISVRELSGVDICRDYFGLDNSKLVLDPTMLIGKYFYLDLLSKYDVSNISKGGLLTYVLDEAEEKQEIIDFLKTNSNVNKVNHLKGFNQSGITYTVAQWLASFAYSDFIVTDSFHGMVFSIIFEKDFVVIGNNERGLDRFTSLLDLIGLKDKLVFNIDDVKSMCKNTIDYSLINKILEDKKENSISFLINALDEGNE